MSRIGIAIIGDGLSAGVFKYLLLERMKKNTKDDIVFLKGEDPNDLNCSSWGDNFNPHVNFVSFYLHEDKIDDHLTPEDDRMALITRFSKSGGFNKRGIIGRTYYSKIFKDNYLIDEDKYKGTFFDRCDESKINPFKGEVLWGYSGDSFFINIQKSRKKIHVEKTSNLQSWINSKKDCFVIYTRPIFTFHKFVIEQMGMQNDSIDYCNRFTTEMTGDRKKLFVPIGVIEREEYDDGYFDNCGFNIRAIKMIVEQNCNRDIGWYRRTIKKVRKGIVGIVDEYSLEFGNNIKNRFSRIMWPGKIRYADEDDESQLGHFSDFLETKRMFLLGRYAEWKPTMIVHDIVKRSNEILDKILE